MKNRASIAPAVVGCNTIGNLACLADAARWVAWCTEERNGKPTKVPYSPVRNGRAKADDPTTWGTRAQAETRAKRLGGAVGVQLGPIDSDCALGGIDLDSCRDTLGELEPWAAEVIDRFASYSETSPSGNGIKVFFLYMLADLPAVQAQMGDAKYRKAFTRGTHHEIALDLGNRYYAVTDLDIGPDADLLGPTPLRLVPRDDLVWLLTEAGPAFAPQIAAADSDESGSGHGYRFLVERAHAGTQKAAAIAELKADDSPAGEWARRVDQRQFDRTWTKAVVKAHEQRFNADTAFEDEADDVSGEHPSLGRTEKMLADRFARSDSGSFRYNATRGRWHVWTGQHWKVDEKSEVIERIGNFCREMTVGLSPKLAAPLLKFSTVANVEKYARVNGLFSVTAADFDTDPWLLGTPGGTVDLRTGILRPADPSDMISRLTAVAPIPLDSFDPERDCPRWMAFLRQALNGDAELIGFMARWMGYSLSADTREEALLFVHGPSGAGKGTFVNTMADMLSDYAIEIPAETLMASRFDRHLTEIARLDGARFGYSSETQEGRAWNESRVKQLTGRDKMTGNFMRQDHFTFTPKLKPIVMSNHRPRLVNMEGMDRRLNVAPFVHPPTVRDETLKDALKAEWPAILSWAIAGCLDWQAHGLMRPAAVREATESYLTEQDTFAQWLDECCERGERLTDTSQRVWDSWSAFATSMGEDAGNRSKSFPERLKAKGISILKRLPGTRERGVMGLRVIERSAFDDGDDDDLV